MSYSFKNVVLLVVFNYSNCTCNKDVILNINDFLNNIKQNIVRITNIKDNKTLDDFFNNIFTQIKDNLQIVDKNINNLSQFSQC